MDTAELETYLEFALEAAWQAGRLTLPHFQTGVAVERKADNTPMTAADLAAERRLRDLIEKHWPEHAIVGEEYGRSAAEDARYTWILDPIDGTKSFVCGVPFYANLVALMHDNEPVLGVAHFPALGETLYARRGGGCYWNGRRARVSQVDKLSEAVLLASGMNYKPFGRRRREAWESLVDATYIQRTWGDAYGYYLVATGRAEIMVDPIMELWDTGPWQVILEEAGGTFTDWQGEATIHNRESVATNGVLFDAVMDLIRASDGG